MTESAMKPQHINCFLV